MNRDNNCNSTVAVLSFLTGAVVGAGIALLVAPRTGEETREILKEYGQDLREKGAKIPTAIKSSAEQAIDRGKDMIEQGRQLISRGTEMVSHGKDYLDEKKQALSAAIEAGKEAMKQEKEKLAASSYDE
ncbi:MAG: YtxH domain-containing protein [Deltaproteobacteria bacterium]|nr:YtxH domain-containing protein [Deltaproteobacteria bacterium]